MSRFPDQPDEKLPYFTGRAIGGAFECDVCGKVSTGAVHNAREQKLYWECPDGHQNSINFRL